MGRLGLDNAIDAIATVRGGLSAGIYPCNVTGLTKYTVSDANEYTNTTFDSTYNIYYFEVDDEGEQYPVQLLTGSPFTLTAGINTAKPIVSAYGNPTVNVIMKLATAIAIVQSSGTAIGEAPSLTANISGGAWSSTSADASNNISFTAITPGSNTVVATQTDPNGDTTDSASIAVLYAETAPIVEIDGQSIASDIETLNYSVPVKYLFGGSLVYREGALVTNLGGVVYYGGTIVTVTGYALLPAHNLVQVTGQTDDFGTTFSTTQEPATKKPALVYDGLTTIDAETYGTSYTATDGLLVDTGAPYATTASPVFAFDSGDYKDYTFNPSYEYPIATGVSSSIPVVIEYQQYDIPKILQLNSNDVSGGQIPKLNTLTSIAVKWLNSSNVEQNDTEAVTAHTNATNITVTRETTATAVYSHKTGLPIPALLYYRDNSGTRVDFNGTFEIPDTVTVSPITFGWSIANGNVIAEVEQTDFTQVLTVDEMNDVIMPTFTDDWGNSSTLASRTQEVAYGETAVNPVLEAVANYSFGTPNVSPDSTRTLRVDGADTYVSQVDDQHSTEPFLQTVEAEQPKLVENPQGVTGIQLHDLALTKMTKAVTGNEKWVLPLCTIVFDFTGTNNRGTSNEDTILYIDFNSRPLMFDHDGAVFGRDGGTVSSKGSSFAQDEFGTVAVCCDVAGNSMTIRDSKGGVNSIAFDGFSVSNPQYVGFFGTLERRFGGIIHRIYVLPTCADATKFEEIKNQSLADYWLPPSTGDGNVQTSDGAFMNTIDDQPMIINP